MGQNFQSVILNIFPSASIALTSSCIQFTCQLNTCFMFVRSLACLALQHILAMCEYILATSSSYFLCTRRNSALSHTPPQNKRRQTLKSKAHDMRDTMLAGCLFISHHIQGGNIAWLNSNCYYRLWLVQSANFASSQNFIINLIKLLCHSNGDFDAAHIGLDLKLNN